MIFHENRLLADNFHEISYLSFFSKIRKDVEKNISAAVVICALRVKVVRDPCQKITLLLLKSKSVRVIVPESFLKENTYL